MLLRPMRKDIVILAALLIGCTAPSAHTTKPEYETPTADSFRDTTTARNLNLQALEKLSKGDDTAAEQLLKKSLTADVMFGPAHNNLGKLYFHQGKLYPAAWEFQYAAKLMPNQPEPRNNLGLVCESAGKLDEAVDFYTQAIKDEPDNPEILGNLARSRIRRGEKSPEVRDLLNKLVERDTRPEWLVWEKDQLLRLSESAPSATP
jgi:Tfp pilus assembly protein PilF